MKNNMKILTALIVTALPVMSVYAQMQLPAPTSPSAAMPINVPMEVGQGNVYEKEITPLLRDISKKKSFLELRRLDRELEKLDEEALTSQIERDKALNPVAVNVNPGSPNFGQNMPSFQAPVSSVSSSAATSDIRVLMIYGYDSDLHAKVSHGLQGGYIVRKGDVLPDGRVVSNINSNFIEVKKGKSNSKGVEKLYVSGPAPVTTGSMSAPVSGGTPGTTVLPSPSTQNAMPAGVPSGAVMLPSVNPGTLPVGTAPVMIRR